MSEETGSKIITDEENERRLALLGKLGELVRKAGVQTLTKENLFLHLPPGLEREMRSGPLDPALVVFRDGGGQITVSTDGRAFNADGKTLPVDKIESMAAWLVLLARP